MPTNDLAQVCGDANSWTIDQGMGLTSKGVAKRPPPGVDTFCGIDYIGIPGKYEGIISLKEKEKYVLLLASEPVDQ